jgi:hypothetical protein
VDGECLRSLAHHFFKTAFNSSNPKGCKESSRWSESAETTGNAILIGSHPGGVLDPSL